MTRISLLSNEVRDFISCGEVIEAPFSAVKELLENALDANAAHIEIKIKDGGLSLINVVDDGEGINFEDLPLAITSYATSKIATKNDLSAIKTLGFRGEALASIANVSHIEIVSATEKGSGGILIAEGGKVLVHEKVSAGKGTSIEVRNLFFNAPVRKRFLKSSQHITSQILGVVQNYAVSFPNVLFSYKCQGESEFPVLASGEGDCERIKKIYGFENPVIAENPSDFVKARILIYPDNLKPSKKWQFVFLNRRPISNFLVLKAVEEALTGYFPPKRFPPVFVFLEAPPSFFDVNVHPTKKEVRFINSGSLFKMVKEVVQKAFSKPASFQTYPEIERHNFSFEAEEPQPGEIKESFFKETRPDFQNLFFVGITHRKYLIFSDSTNVYFVDFHAASERINYEKIKADFEKNSPSSQKLLIPLEAKLTQAEIITLAAKKDLLYALGLDVEFEEGKAIIKAVPSGFRGDEKTFLEEIASSFSSAGDAVDGALKTIACHLSPRAGDEISREEAQKIVKSLSNCAEPMRCPHGRPTFVEIPVSRLDALFNR